MNSPHFRIIILWVSIIIKAGMGLAKAKGELSGILRSYGVVRLNRCEANPGLGAPMRKKARMASVPAPASTLARRAA